MTMCFIIYLINILESHAIVQQDQQRPGRKCMETIRETNQQRPWPSCLTEKLSYKQEQFAPKLLISWPQSSHQSMMSDLHSVISPSTENHHVHLIQLSHS